MFTLTDICNIAIQIERNGEMTYRSASRKISDEQLAQMLAWMADEEARHAQWFRTLNADINLKPSSEHVRIETMGSSLLQEMMKNQTFSLDDTALLAADDILGLLSQSIEFEQDTILFYEMLRSFIDDDDTIDQLNAVIAEEHGHIEQLERLRTIYRSKRKEG